MLEFPLDRGVLCNAKEAIIGPLRGRPYERGRAFTMAQFGRSGNAVLRKIGERFYIIVQAWNPGDFAILEQVQ